MTSISHPLKTQKSARLVEPVEAMTLSEIAMSVITPKVLLALLARMLFREGYDEHLAGHISFVQPDDTLLVTPFGRAWDEVRGSDIVTIDRAGQVIGGPQEAVTPAITLHLALHLERPGTRVVVHHHPQWATIWAAKGEVPPAYDQLSSLIHEDRIAVVSEFSGPVDGWDAATKNVTAMGQSDCALLGNHGVLVVGNSIEEAHFRAVCLEWRAKQAWRVAAIGGGSPMPVAQRQLLANKFDRNLGGTIPHLFPAMIRREIRADSSVLE